MFKLVVLLSVAAMAVAKPQVLAPLAYSSVVTPGLSSVSQYSSSVVHGSPAYGVPSFYSTYGAPTVYSAYGAPVYGAGLAPAFGALSQAPNQPAVVLDAVNGVPLDTPEVVAARAAHYTAKALAPFHHLKKRSVGLAPVSYSSVVAPVSYTSPLVSTYSAAPYSAAPYSAYSSFYGSPYGYGSLYPRAYSVHPY